MGDFNSSFFHKAVNWKINISRIDAVYDMDGNFFCGGEVDDKFVKHFKGVLGGSSLVEDIADPASLFHAKIPKEEVVAMVKKVTKMEIKEALDDIGGDKAPGPDGYSAKFLKASWDVLGMRFVLLFRISSLMVSC